MASKLPVVLPPAGLLQVEDFEQVQDPTDWVKVRRVQDVPVAIPAPADDQKVLTYDNPSQSMLWKVPGIGGGVGITASCRVFNGANQLIPNGVATVLAFPSERWDPDGMHDPVVNNSRITAPTDGTFEVAIGVQWDANAIGMRTLQIRLNGATMIRQVDVLNLAAVEFHHQANVKYQVVAGDYFEVLATQTSGLALNILGVAQTSAEFEAARYGGTAQSQQESIAGALLFFG